VGTKMCINDTLKSVAQLAGEVTAGNVGFKFGPRINEDWWSRMIMLKVLMQYAEVTGDQRVVPFMTKYFRYQAAHLKERPLTGWSQARGGEHDFPRPRTGSADTVTLVG